MFKQIQIFLILRVLPISELCHDIFSMHFLDICLCSNNKVSCFSPPYQYFCMFVFKHTLSLCLKVAKSQNVFLILSHFSKYLTRFVSDQFLVCIKFRYSEKAAKFWKISPYFFTLLKGQLISEWILDSSFEPKNEPKYFCISALCSEGWNLDNFLFIFWEKRWLC